MCIRDSYYDCLYQPGGPLMGFNCGGNYSVVVTPPAVSLPPPATTTVTIDDINGFSPQALTIQSGQTVTWMNKGTATHSVRSSLGVAPLFDSGGIGPGQSWSHAFTGPALVGYASTTEPVYNNDNGLAVTMTTYKFVGTISVQSPPPS